MTIFQRDTKVMFDADVLFSASISHLFLSVASTGAFSALWTRAIENEALHSLARTERHAALRAFEQNVRLIEDPLVTGFERGARNFPNTHAKDRHVAAAAAHSQCAYLVTGNTRHFNSVEAAACGFTVVTPDELGALLVEHELSALVASVRPTPHDRFQAYMSRLKMLLPMTYEPLAEAFRAAGYDPP